MTVELRARRLSDARKLSRVDLLDRYVDMQAEAIETRLRVSRLLRHVGGRINDDKKTSDLVSDAIAKIDDMQTFA